MTADPRAALAAAVVAARAFATPTPPLSLDRRLRMLPLDGAALDRPVAVRWNDHAVPFIEAGTDGDLAFALGVVHRHLRQAQLEVFRRLAAGRLASMIGALGLPLDRSIRLIGLREAAERIAPTLPPATRLWADRFVDGLNHHGRHAAPAPELAALGIARFVPWTLLDFLTVARLYGNDLTWPLLTRLLARRDRTTRARWRAEFRHLLRLPPDRDAAAGTDVAERLLDGTARAGSNAAALAAGRSASGGALLGGDPHLAIGLPNTWLLAGLRSPTIHAVGIMLPGMPFIACGRNRDIAWGGTALHAASSELVDLSDEPAGRFRVEEEPVPVRFRRRPAILRRRRSPHGPVVSDGPLFRSRTPVALRWIGERPTDELSAMLAVLRAADRDGFRTALDGFAVPAQCMVYAGPDGIGRQAAAHLPKRDAAVPADLVVPPAEAARDWSAVVTGRDLFSEWDPPDGVIASANEFLEGPPPDRVPLGRFFASDDRVSRLRALLAPAHGTFDLDRFAAVFRDERQPRVLPLRDRLLRAIPPALPERREGFAAALRDWDGTYDEASRGALAFELLLAGTAAALLPPGERAALRSVWATRALVAERIAGSVPDALARAVRRALPGASRRFRRLGHWGAAHRHELRHPFALVPVGLRSYRTARFPGAGGNDTLNKTGHGPVRTRHRIRFGGTARYAFDLGDADANGAVLFGGQDGWPGSAQFADQVALWRRGQLVRLPLDPARVAALFPHLTVLRPARGDRAPP